MTFGSVVVKLLLLVVVVVITRAEKGCDMQEDDASSPHFSPVVIHIKNNVVYARACTEFKTYCVCVYTIITIQFPLFDVCK